MRCLRIVCTLRLRSYATLYCCAKPNTGTGVPKGTVETTCVFRPSSESVYSAVRAVCGIVVFD